LKELMDRVDDAVANPRHCAKGVGARSKVSPLAEFLKRVAFFLQRVRFGIRRSDQLDSDCLNFGGLAFPTRLFDFTFDGDAAAGGQLLDFRLIIFQRVVGNDLNVALA